MKSITRTVGGSFLYFLTSAYPGLFTHRFVAAHSQLATRR